MRLSHVAIATAMVFAAGLSQAAVTYNKEFNFGTAGLNVFESFTATGPSKLNFTLTPNAASTGDLANLFGFSWRIAPTYQNAGLISTVFAPGQKSFAGTFDIQSAGNYQFGFFSAAAHNWTGKLNVQVAPVPEPETYALMGMGLLGLMAARRRKMAK